MRCRGTCSVAGVGTSRPVACRGHGALLLLVLVAVAIILVLMFGNFGGGSYSQGLAGARREARQTAADINVRHLAILIAQHRVEHGRLPTRPEDLDNAEAFRDAYGNTISFTYDEPRPGGATQVTFRSAGPDGVAGNEDDLVATAPLPY